MKNAVIVTAADANFFHMLLGLILSIQHRAHPVRPAIVVLDVGLTCEQHHIVQDLVTDVVIPGWDFAEAADGSHPSWVKAMTVRPHLPRYIPGYDVYLWIDGDAWVQSWACVEDLIAAARTGSMAIVEEVYGQPVSFDIPTSQGPKRFTCSPEQVKRNISSWYARHFGSDIAVWLGEVPSFNAGVWALPQCSSAWQVWHDYMADGFKRGGFRSVVDQAALNLAIRRHEIAIAQMPVTANFLCTHALPAFDPDASQFVVPLDGAVIGILHLADVKAAHTVSLNTYPAGDVVDMPLHYLDFLFSCFH